VEAGSATKASAPSGEAGASDKPTGDGAPRRNRNRRRRSGSGSGSGSGGGQPTVTA